ncbi:glycosyl hydrolase family 28 protein [Mucilaginibacter boryungensis]|uniref:Endo-polygalacturonase n=1 Tax=Mucilaginibacter boryungensis TaxID=768480 RepID=A0ABR9XC92_9SPHI|nr:glycosyl hydrolase family 28 protein [Mucilaginibacter boryungensis]MBE9665016.1 endo-polygalacturonase [Mucilaginibacter boryungensis]
MRLKLLFFSIAFHFTLFAYPKLITYKAPHCNILSNTYTVQVREANLPWQTVATYFAHVTDVTGTKGTVKKTSFGYFDCSGKVEVTVLVNDQPIKSVRIRPTAKGIVPLIHGNKITFLMNISDQLSIEINGDIFNNLQLFANPLETDSPSPNDPSVIYFGPGAHRAGKLNIPSGKTVYIAGGAVVQGNLYMDHAENVKVRGRGIFTQLENAVPDTAPVDNQAVTLSRNDAITVNYSKNVVIEGLIILPHKYSITIGQSSEVLVNNFKSFSSEGNADGIDIFCSNDIKLDHIFMRNADDCIAIYGHRWNYYGNTRNILIKNAVLWADVAHPIMVGTHGDTQHPDTLANMLFENIDILDQHENQLDYQGCLALNAGDNNLITNIKFNDIRIEDIRKGQLVNLRVMYNKKYNTSPGNRIENISFINVSSNGNHTGMSVIAGYDENRLIRNILFENLKINGQLITDDMAGKPPFYKTGDMANIFIGEHVDGIKFVKTQL